MNRSLHTKRSLKVQKEEQKLLKDEIGWQPLKESTKLPKVLKDEIGEDELSLAIDLGFGNLAVIEITGCVHEETMKVEPTVQRLIERADTYTEYVPWSDGIRIIGRSFGQAVNLDCRGETSDSTVFTISINHDCDRWVDFSGIPILDKRFRNIERLIDELLAEKQECIYFD